MIQEEYEKKNTLQIMRPSMAVRGKKPLSAINIGQL
jgi:hypothetical protein